jgi:hypothetical protein
VLHVRRGPASLVPALSFGALGEDQDVPAHKPRIGPCGRVGSVHGREGRPSATQTCPICTAPATTAVPRALGGSMAVGPGAFTLFNGAVPPNGFMVQLNYPSELGNFCWVNDNGPTAANPPTGFLFGGLWVNSPLPSTFVTPPGYKPMGPVSIYCPGSVYIEFRGW